MSRTERRSGDVEVGYLGSPQPMSARSSQTASDFGDSSAPLFSMYSKMTEREDDKAVERWQKDAQVILIFVSPVIPFHTTPHPNWKTCRPPCCRSSSQYSSPCPFKTSGQTSRTPPHSISRTSIKSSLTLMHLTSLHPSLNHRRSIHQHTPSG